MLLLSRMENERKGLFDHFDLFHNIHFSSVELADLDKDIILQFCGLFRVDPDKMAPFNNCKVNTNSTTKLPEKSI